MEQMRKANDGTDVFEMSATYAAGATAIGKETGLTILLT